jgi:hypothetical protein
MTMKHGPTAALAAGVIAGLALPTMALAECNPRNPTACTSDSQAGTPAAAQPQAAAQSSPAAKPLQLKRFMSLGPARRTASRSDTRRAADKKTKKAATATEREETTRPLAEVTAPLEPKAVTTLSIGGPAVAVTTATDGTVGFAAATEPWRGIGAFADSDERTPPPGVTIARFDEINEIDLAADTETMAREHAAKSDRVSVSLTSPAHAATPESAATAPAPEPKPSWLSWLYGKLIDGVLTLVLAIRSFFV